MFRQVGDVDSLPLLLCFLFPSASCWCEVGRGSDRGGEGRGGASFPHGLLPAEQLVGALAEESPRPPWTLSIWAGVWGAWGMGSIGWVWAPAIGGSRCSRLCQASLRLPGSLLLGVGLGAVGSGCLLSVVPEPHSGQWAGLSWLRGRSEPQDLSFLGSLGTPKSVGAPSCARPWGGTGGRGTWGPCGHPGRREDSSRSGECKPVHITPSPRPPAPQSSASPSPTLLPSPDNSALPPGPPISGAGPPPVSRGWASGHCPWMKGNEGERVWGRWLR